MENKQHEAKSDSERLQEAFDNLKAEIINSPFGRVMKRVIYTTLDGLSKFLEGRVSK
jgi:hypothetical protein